MLAKLDRRQGQFSSIEFKLVSKQGKTLLNWCRSEHMDTFLKEHGFRRLNSGMYETDKELKKNGTFADVEQQATDGDLPIGDLKMNTGNGVNNYSMPSIPVQGATERLLATKEAWPFPEDKDK